VLCAADIYRYQDSQGIWHFTDNPPPGADPVPGYNRPKEKPPTADLRMQLERNSEASTPVSEAALSVVTVKVGEGGGSGFFCTQEGHILTNLHVIRPSAAGQFQVKEDALQGKEKSLAILEQKRKAQREKLRLMQQDLEGYERVIEGAKEATTRDWATGTHARLSDQYRTTKAALKETERELESVSRELRRDRRDLNLERSSEAVSNAFDLLLKDGTELTATLVGENPERDLALLKIEGFRTPYLPLTAPSTLSQGQRVFAIGNPLGMQNSVTSGVITRVTPEYIHTDVQILPGNSGGPLIAEDGELIGINVAKDVAEGASMYSVGFGKTIPVAAALHAFPQLRVAEDRIDPRPAIDFDFDNPRNPWD
jgi:S1-C subfamily serine protease